MSQISREIEVLIYLNKKRNRDRYVNTKEIADYLEISPRQARRYFDDLIQILEIPIEVKRGRDGGYRLTDPLPDNFIVPENFYVALSISMKKNKRLENVLSTLPNFISTSYIDGDNYIDDETVNKIERIIEALENKKIFEFKYKNLKRTFIVIPYKIYFTNHTYYLCCVHGNEIKMFDISKINKTYLTASYIYDEEIAKRIENNLTNNFGIKNIDSDCVKTTLRVKCKDKEALDTFYKYFEGKGSYDQENLIFQVSSNSENELFYPLFRISTKIYEFLDEEFKNEYIKYLKNQIRSIEER